MCLAELECGSCQGWLRNVSPWADGYAGTRVIVLQRGELGLKKLPGSLTLCCYLL